MNYKDYVKQNNAWELKAEKLFEIQKLKSHYTKLSSQLSKELIDLSGKQNCVGSRFVFHSYTRKGSIDYTSIPELQHINLDIFRKDDIQLWKLENVGESFLKKIDD